MDDSQTAPLVADENQGDEYWKDQLEKFESFPGSAREYCKQNGLRYGRFYRYKRKFGFIKVRRAPQKAFVQIKAVEETAEKEKLVVRPRASTLPDPKWMAEFIKELLGRGQ
jgi:hypothetical protein